MKSRAEEAGSAYEKALAEAKGRAQTLARETRSQLSAESDAKRKALEADLNKRLADAEATIASKKSEAMGHVHGIAHDTATAIIERLTGKAPAPQTVAQWRPERGYYAGREVVARRVSRACWNEG